jgi:LPS-assembly lipoprotein
MSWFENALPLRRIGRLAIVVALGALTAGCFRPLYAERGPDGGPGIKQMLSAVDVQPIVAANGTPEARIGNEVRNALIFSTTGGSGSAPPTHRLTIRLAPSRAAVVVDPRTARSEIENYGIDASYTLTDIVSGKQVVQAQTFARVSFDVPGQEQRFARIRGLRDAENRAAKVISDQITNRLISYFAAGT